MNDSNSTATLVELSEDMREVLANPDCALNSAELNEAADIADEQGKKFLAEYCREKGKALDARKHGKMAQAEDHLFNCHLIYINIPEVERWQ